ncbi:TetR/AcrR family transcriptional regulator [Echinicola sp. 20G]|uniref:TetR/AcrR family transcriptional regulator n=1 Tax=Echinicola sp. 20G TaxID=2781961 RepID=UPI00190FC605|nr:TetR/AcrR family transcriptional regulator [Echinicola sp. 20G]
MDRRVKKSRQALFDAFTKLMVEHPFQKLSIAMVTKEADVNRGTFYLHFKDKFELREQCIDMHLTQLMTSCAGGSKEEFTSKKAMLTTFDYLNANAAFYKVMLTGEDNTFFRKRMEEILKVGLSDFIESKTFKDPIDKEIMMQATISAGAGLIEWWLTTKNELDPGYLVERFWDIIYVER